METYSAALKRAREEKGLTPSQVASKTRLLVQIVEDLEVERFKNIPAPIYGRGFVRLYAECVGLDPAPLVADFMAAFNGTRPKVSERLQTPTLPATETAETEPTPEPEPESDEAPAEPAAEAPAIEPIAEPPPVVNPFAAKPIAPIDEPPPVVRGLDLFEQAERVARVRAAAQQMSGGAPSASPYITSATYKPETAAAHAPSKTKESASAAENFRKGLSSVSHGVLGQAKQIPPSVWRISFLAAAATVVIALVSWACFALYRFTENGVPGDELSPTRQAPILAEAPKENSGVAQAKQTAKPQGTIRSTGGRKIPQLYVD